MDLRDAEYKYMNDHVFHAFVEAILSAIHDLQLTPLEIRQAAMFAALIHEREMSKYKLLWYNPHDKPGGTNDEG